MSNMLLDVQDSSDSDKSFERIPKKKTKISYVNEQSIDTDISIDEGTQNVGDIEIDNFYDFNDQSLNKNQTEYSEDEDDDDDDFNIDNYEDSESEDYVSNSNIEFDSETCVIYETNSKITGNEKNDSESIKSEARRGKNYSNNEEKINKTYKSLDVDNDEVYGLLEKSYKDKKKISNQHKKKSVTKDDYVEHDKVVLEEVGMNHFDILPENWIQTTHKSGMPIYLHKKTRVVTLSRPYYLGTGDPKSHLAPLSAISCLKYRKGLEAKEILKNEPDFQVGQFGDMIIPKVKVETAQENTIKESLTHEELREYCQSLFKLQVKEVKSPCNIPKEQKIKTEIHSGPIKTSNERPSLPNSTKLISFPVQTEDNDKLCDRRQKWLVYTNGKSYLTMLTEYLQRAFKIQPWYEIKELENTETPYSATVMVNDVQYGVGFGNNKKQAKLNAAKVALEIFIPELKNIIDSDIKNNLDLEIFDQIKVTDSRIAKFCARTTEPSPYTMLLVCLKRNFSESEINIEFKFNNHIISYQCTMTVGKHTASAFSKNKMDAKQKASQVMLGILHPHIDNWGSLLRLYGNKRIKNAREKKQNQREITQLENKAAVNQPNFAVLNKLKEEMLKTRDQKKLKETKEMLELPMAITITCPYTIGNPSTSKCPY